MNTELQPLSNNNLLNVILEHVSDGIFIADRNYNTIAYSKLYREYLGATEEEMATKKITEFYQEGWLSCIPIADIIERKQPCSNLIKYYKTSMEILCTGVPVMEQDEIAYVILTFRDLTKLKHLESELRTSKNLIDKYKDQISFAQNHYAAISGENINGIVYRSSEMRQLLEQIKHIAQYDSCVLITGETGTGKSMFASLIHQLSSRATTGKFVKLDCSNIPENLLESELFGYSRGSFTGANPNGKIGLVEMADGGTLFLDEIGELPIQLQSKLLSMIEEKRIKRIGDTEYHNVNIRIISATNRNLLKLMQKGAFRRDLYYRLNVLLFHIPPLASRQEDIIPLINHYLKYFSVKYNINYSLSLKAYQVLFQYDWPGNIRELMHTMERIILLGEETVLKDLHNKITPQQDAAGDEIPERLDIFMSGIEKTYLARALSSSKSVRACAQTLGIDVSTLVRKMKRYGLSKQNCHSVDAH